MFGLFQRLNLNTLSKNITLIYLLIFILAHYNSLTSLNCYFLTEIEFVNHFLALSLPLPLSNTYIYRLLSFNLFHQDLFL